MQKIRKLVYLLANGLIIVGVLLFFLVLASKVTGTACEPIEGGSAYGKVHHQFLPYGYSCSWPDEKQVIETYNTSQGPYTQADLDKHKGPFYDPSPYLFLCGLIFRYMLRRTEQK
ncbi:MAG: hypothetical protein V4702_03320 [Patescibacteria group bacterium]